MPLAKIVFVALYLLGAVLMLWILWNLYKQGRN